MVNISIDVTDLGGEARPGDKVVLWKPAAAGSSSHAGRVISTAPVDVFLTNGKASVPDVEPGEMRVLLQCRGVESQGPIDVTVPDGNGTVTLRSLIESQFEYAPPIVSAVQEAAANASASERAAIEAQVRSEAAADRADAKVDDAINNGANLVRNEVKQDADRAVAARQAATQSESNAAASETNAKQSETNAGDFAAVATTAATEAVDAMEAASEAVSSIGDSVSRAAASADSASRSEANAAQYESSAATHAQNATEAADKVGTAAELDAWAQAAQEAADRVGTAEQVGVWASEASSAVSRAEQAETNAKASETSAGSSATDAKASEDAAAASAVEAGSHAGSVQESADQAQAARDEVVPLAGQVAADASATAAHRAHVDDQVSAIDTAFTDSIPPYLQPDSPTGLAQTYGTKGYIYEAGGEVETLINPPRTDVTIRQELPHVTLEQVQALDPDATLDDTADWFVVQKHIADCAAGNVRSIRLPRGRYYMSRGVDFSALEYGTHVEASGVIFWATQPMDNMVLLRHAGNYWKARRFSIHGLELRGNYVAKNGISVDGVQEWSIDVRVHSCYTGFAMEDTWYGQISRESIIQDCLVGLAFNTGNAMEINTIGIDNLKINFSVDKSRFTDSPEADSIGISISTILAGIDFHAVVVEGMDYGVRYMPQRAGSGRMDGLVMFTGCYWEHIKKRVFDFSRVNEGGFTHAVNSLIIQGNRFHASPGVSVMGLGSLTMVGNQDHKIRFENFSSGPSRTSATIDANVEVAHEFSDRIANSRDQQLFINTLPAVPVNIDTDRFAKWGNSGVFPAGDAMVSTLGHANYQLGAPPAKLRGSNQQPSKYFVARSIMPRPVVFYPGSHGEPNGPVVQGEDDKWYMLRVAEGGAVEAREVRNVNRIDESAAARTAKELYLMRSKANLGTRHQVIDIHNPNNWVTLADVDGVRSWVDDESRVRVGTTAQALEAHSALYNGAHFADVSTGQTLLRTGDSYTFIDWYGSSTGFRVHGTIGQRPATPVEGLVFYDTSAGEYTVYRGDQWMPFTPHVTA